MGLLISALYMLLNIAIILLVAYVLLWVIRDWFGVAIDGMVLKFAQVVVALLCLIVFVIWLAGVLGHTGYRLPFSGGSGGAAVAAISTSTAADL